MKKNDEQKQSTDLHTHTSILNQTRQHRWQSQDELNLPRHDEGLMLTPNETSSRLTVVRITLEILLLNTHTT